MSEQLSGWRAALADLFLRSRVSLLGASIATSTAIAIIALMALGLTGRADSPYIGILGFLVFPAVFVLGLLLVPLGWWMARRGLRKLGQAPEHVKIDFGVGRFRREFGIIAFLTLVNLFLISAASFQGVTYMETEQFCGQVCHTVMEPEFTAHQTSPHGRVSCVECHIGPGAESFVKAKLNGVNQVLGVAFGSYERPIPVPLHNLPPAKETCLKCHDPNQYIGDQLRVFTEYGDDEANTPMHSVLMMKVGGGGATSGGIHSWHNNPNKRILFHAADEKRQDIQYVRVEHDDGTVVEYIEDGSNIDPNTLDPATLREMDCTDCHNRPAHTFELPNRALDAAMARGIIDPAIPSIKKAGLDALHDTAQNGGTAEDAVAQLRAYYETNHVDYARENAGLLDRAAQEVHAIYARNIFPKMNIGWGTYPDNRGHVHFEGCFRCHDDSHSTPDGEVISQDCTICHGVLAFQEEAPDILGLLNP